MWAGSCLKAELVLLVDCRLVRTVFAHPVPWSMLAGLPSAVQLLE